MLYLCLIKFWMQSYEIYFKIVCFKAEKMQNNFLCGPSCYLSAAESGVGTGTAAVTVIGGSEAEIGREDGVGSLFEEGDETVTVDGYVGDGFTTDDKRGIIAIGSGMLDEKQRW